MRSSGPGGAAPSSPPQRPAVAPPAGGVHRPDVPGVVVGALLGVGSTGAVWAGVDAQGRALALKVLTPLAARHLGAEVDVLRALDHPHVVALRDVVVCSAGVVLVLDRAAGGSLAGLVAERGPLRPGEVATIVVALGSTLGELHERGLVHADVTPHNVLLDGRGRPLLADWGLAGVVGLGTAGTLDGGPAGTPGYADPSRGDGEPAGAPGDVRALAATAWFALTGSPPPATGPAGPTGQERARAAAIAAQPADDPSRALAAVLARALDPDPSARPTGAELSRRCWEAVEVTPVQLVGVSGPATSDAVTRRLRQAAAAHAPASVHREERRPRRSLPVRRTALVVLVVAAGASVAVAARGGTGRDPASRALDASPRAAAAGTTAAEPATRDPDPLTAVRALAAARDRAITEADPQLLAGVDVPGGAPDRADRAVVAQLAATGTSVRQRSSRVVSAVLVDATGRSGGRGADDRAADGDQAWVRVRVVTSAHQLVAAGGGTTRVPASGEVTSLLVLQRTGGRWLVAGSA